MSIAKFIKHQAKELLIVTLFFLSGFLPIVGLFELMLEDYGIHFNAWVKAVVGALVLAEVVLILRGRHGRRLPGLGGLQCTRAGRLDRRVFGWAMELTPLAGSIVRLLSPSPA